VITRETAKSRSVVATVGEFGDKRTRESHAAATVAGAIDGAGAYPNALTSL